MILTLKFSLEKSFQTAKDKFWICKTPKIHPRCNIILELLIRGTRDCQSTCEYILTIIPPIYSLQIRFCTSHTQHMFLPNIIFILHVFWQPLRLFCWGSSNISRNLTQTKFGLFSSIFFQMSVIVSLAGNKEMSSLRSLYTKRVF